MDVFELKKWFSIDGAAARLSQIEGKVVSPDTVLCYLYEGQLQASIHSRQVIAVPLVCMSDDEAKNHIGSSWRNPNGRLMAAISHDNCVMLTAIKPVLDLPVCLSGVGELVLDASTKHLDVNSQIRIPPGTLVQTPGKDEYFAVLGGSDIPATFGKLVIRTDALREFESRLIVHKKDLAANDGAAVVPASDDRAETKEQRQDRRLQACIDAGLPMDTKAALSRLPNGVSAVADKEQVTRQAFSSDVKAALKRLENAKKEGAIVRHT